MNTTQKNIVVVSLIFDFQGKTIQPQITVDLDEMILAQQNMDQLYHRLAVSIGLDIHRHEYDVLVMQPLVFSSPTGMATEFVNKGHLDYENLVYEWWKMHSLKVLQPIALQHLNISDLSEHLALQHALIEAYKAGEKSVSTIRYTQTETSF